MSGKPKDLLDPRTPEAILIDCKTLIRIAQVGLRRVIGDHEEEDQLRLSIVFMYTAAIFATFKDRLAPKCDAIKYRTWRSSFHFSDWASLPVKGSRLNTFIDQCTAVRNDIMHGSLFVFGPKSVTVAIGESPGAIRIIKLTKGPPEYSNMKVDEVCKSLIGRMVEFVESAEQSLI